MSKVAGFIIGGLEVIAGAILVATGIGGPIGVELIVAGATTIVSQAVLDLTAPKTPARDASEMTLALGEQPRVMLVGETFTPGSLVDGFDYGGKYGTDWEVLVIRLADHPCHSLTGFYVNDEWNPYTGDGIVSRYDDQFEIYFRANTSIDPLPSIVTANGPGWTSADIGRSGCDVIVAYKADKPDDKHPGWPGGRPHFGFVVKSKLCYDPRKDSTVPGGSGAHRWTSPTTWEWTDNAVICRYNWVRGIFADDDVSDPTKLLIGRGLTAEEAPPENIFAAANLCDVDAAAIKPFQQSATTVTGTQLFAFGGSYCAYLQTGGQLEWWDVRTHSRLGVSASPGAMAGALPNVSLPNSGVAYALAPKLPSGNLYYIVTAPMKAPVSTQVATAVSSVIQVTRALDTIDGLRVFGAYQTAAGYLADLGAGMAHVSLTGACARDFCIDSALHPWMATQPTGSSNQFTLKDLKTGASTTFTGLATRSGPSNLRFAYCAAGGNFLVNTDGHFYIIDKATMTITANGVPAWGADRPDTQQVTDRSTFWDIYAMSEYSLKTGALVRALNEVDWVSSADFSFTYDAINNAIWSTVSPATGLISIRFLDRSGPWRVAGPVYANQAFIDVEEMFAAACAGSLVTHEGSIELEPAQAKSVVASFTDADLIVGEQAKWNQGFLSQADAQWLNTVVARYIEPDQRWNDHAAPVMRDTADIIADGQPREASLTLRLVRYQAQALRIAEINRRLGRIWGRASVVLGPRFCEIEAGDWIQWQSDRHFAGATKTFRVDANSIDEKWRNTLTLREIDAGVYADDAVFPLDSAVPTTSPPPPDVGTPAPGAWTLTPTQLVSAGASVPVLVVSGASDDDQAEKVVVEYWKSDGIIDPVANPDAPPWTMVGSYGPGAANVQLPTPTGGAQYYAAVSYVVSGVAGDRIVIGPQTAGSLSITAAGLAGAAAFQTLTDGATINWDMTPSCTAKVTLGGNRTLATPTHPQEGMTYSLLVIQDATGTRTMTWPASFDWGAIGGPTLSTAAGKKDLVTLQCLDAVAPLFRAVFSKAA